MKVLNSFRNGCIALAAILGLGGIGTVAWSQGQQVLTTLVSTDYLAVQHGTYLAAISAPNMAAYVQKGSGAAGTNGQVYLGVTSAAPKFATMSQDCSITNAGVITCTKTNNVAFGTAAVVATGTSGATIPLLNGVNVWSGATNTFSGMIVTSAGLPTIASGACGTTTNGAVVTGSTNQAGNITIGSAGTSTCTVSFSATLGTAPKSCIIQPTNATAAAVGTTGAYISSITTAQFVITGTLASSNYSYICL